MTLINFDNTDVGNQVHIIEAQKKVLNKMYIMEPQI